MIDEINGFVEAVFAGCKNEAERVALSRELCRGMLASSVRLVALGKL